MLNLIRTNCSGNQLEIIVEAKGFEHWGRYYFDFDGIWSEWDPNEYTAEEWVELDEVKANIAAEIVDEFGCGTKEAKNLVERAFRGYENEIYRGSIIDD